LGLNEKVGGAVHTIPALCSEVIPCPSTNTGVSSAAGSSSSLCGRAMPRLGAPTVLVGESAASYRCSQCPARAGKVLCLCRGRAARPAMPAVAQGAASRVDTEEELWKGGHF